MVNVTLLVPCKDANCHDVEARTRMWDWQTLVIRDRLYGEALKMGLFQATTRYVATMDADGQHTTADLRTLYDDLLVESADMVIGRQRGKPRGVRSLASGMLNLAASILAGEYVPDFGSGLRIFKRDLALDYVDSLPDGFDFNAVLTMKFLLEGRDVRWVDVPYHPRQRGTRHVRFSDGLKTLRSLYRVVQHDG